MSSKLDLSKKFIPPLNTHLISNIFGARVHFASKHIFGNYLAPARKFMYEPSLNDVSSIIWDF